MAKQPDFDLSAAHRHFSVACFNRAWELIDKPVRTPGEDEDMVRLALASHWHWTQRKDYTPTSEAIAHWQTSRIYALIGRADEARRYGELSLRASERGEVGPFYLGYAYEALARAEAAAGDRPRAEEFLKRARAAAAAVPEPDDRALLLKDLDTILPG